MGFEAYHPAINFGFFAISLVVSMLIINPVFSLLGAIFAALYYLLLNGKKGLKLVFGALGLWLIISFANPLLVTKGSTVLFMFFGRKYTLEALIYGGCLGAMFFTVMLWFGCYNKIMTADKFLCLFGKLIPALSMLLCMIFRLIPTLERKGKSIAQAREGIGKGLDGAGIGEKVNNGAAVLSQLTGIALEGSVVTADSMKARGYGCAKRSSFTIYKFTLKDYIVGFIMALSLTGIIYCAARGGFYADFYPVLAFSSDNPAVLIGLISCIIIFSLPSLIHIFWEIKWSLLKSKI